MIVVEIKPSRLRVTSLVILHLAAAFSFVFGLDVGSSGFLVVVVLAVSLFRCLVASRRGLPMTLCLKSDGGMLLQPDGVGEVDAAPTGASVVLEPVLWLAWREQQGGRRGVLLLVKDQLSPPDWRRLQVWVRLRARPGVVPTNGQPEV